MKQEWARREGSKEFKKIKKKHNPRRNQKAPEEIKKAEDGVQNAQEGIQKAPKAVKVNSVEVR